jgi:uncharacterized repeat protein (TIGR01451 family)/MYXO-CTERM domain-containing protein
MGLGNQAPRMVSAAFVLLSSLSAAPALAQTTLTVQLGAPPNPGTTDLTAISAISFGGSGDYVARLKVAGTAGDTATDVTLTVAPPAVIATGHGIPTAATKPEFVTVSSTSTGCDTNKDTGAMTCTLGTIATGDSVDVPFSVNLPVPTKLVAGSEAIPSDPSDCPSEEANQFLGQLTTTVTATGATVTQAPVADTKVKKYADLSADLSGPATANVGQTVTYTAKITNNGPCTSINVFVDTLVSSGLIFASGDGACTTDDQCSLGDFAPGQSASFTKTYKVDTLRNNLTSTNNPNNITVHSGDSSDPTAIVAGTDDPDSSNDSPSTTTFVQTSTGGCSSAGSATPWVIAVLALVGLAARRRWVA